jgi:hypothetical protein
LTLNYIYGKSDLVNSLKETFLLFFLSGRELK